MKIDCTTAAVDNDFICHLSEANLPENTLIEKLKIIFSELGFTAIIHPMVYDNEVMHSKERIKLLFSEKIIQKVEFSEIFEDDDSKKAYYIMLVKELFKSLYRGDVLDIADENILEFWRRRMSLGEIHSIAMCLTCGCNIFLSDDDDSKKLLRIIKNKFRNSIKVYDREELIEKHLLEGETTIPRDIRKSLSHKVSQRQ